MRRIMMLGLATALALGTLATPAAAGDEQPSITEIAVGDGRLDKNPTDFDILAAAVGAAGLAETLDSDDVNLTVFAPNDRAFRRLVADLGGPAHATETELVGWLVDNVGVETITSVLLYHVVDGEVFSADLPGLDGAEVPTLLGPTFTIDFSQKGEKIRVRLIDQDPDDKNPRLVLSGVDIDASNGVVHTINRVLRPIDLP